MTIPLKILDLFCGIGSVEKALRRSNIDYKILDAVDNDPEAIDSYNLIHDTNYRPQDINNWDKDMSIDILIHTSPC